jgi:hypothetical protein
MSLRTRVEALASRVAGEFNAVRSERDLGWDAHVNGQLLGGGFKAWTFDPVVLNGGVALPANGVMYLVGLWTPVDITVSNIYYSVQTAGATLTAGQNHVALYGSDRTRLGSVNQDTAFTSTGLKTAAITPVAVPAGRFWVGFLANGTTRPSINRAVGQGLAVLNGLHAGTAARFASSGTSQTTPPAGPITLAAITSTTYWAAVA